MGRTSRKRRQRKKHIFNSNADNQESIFEHLKFWMLSRNWTPVCHLIPYDFPITGRGLKTLQDIKSKETLIRIPRNLLITTASIAQSNIRPLFQASERYEAQSVLAVFIIYETHLHDSSNWKPYLDTVPNSYTNPDFCTEREKRTLPKFIMDYLRPLSKKVKDNYATIVRSMNCLRSSDEHICRHCNAPLDDILTFSKYKWAYYAVNTRAVYVDPVNNQNEMLNIKNDDNLALAPFLDLFNHMFDARVATGLTRDMDEKEFYEITTLKPFEQESQVFINYGAHCNLKLYMEYGFYISQNPLDEIYFDVSDMKNCTVFSECRYNFMTMRGFDRNMGFNTDGLNYNAKVALFILTTKLEQRFWLTEIYGGKFIDEEILEINNTGKKLCSLKKDEMKNQLKRMKDVKAATESFRIAMGLIEEYISILNRCMENLSKT